MLGSRPEVLRECLDAGATDLGGISPLDEVNPSYPFPDGVLFLRILHLNSKALLTVFWGHLLLLDFYGGLWTVFWGHFLTGCGAVVELKRTLAGWGYELRERLPVHERHASAPWVRAGVLPVMEKWQARMHGGL